MAWSLIIGASNRTANVRRGDDFEEPEFELERNTRGMLRFDLDLATAPALRSNVLLSGRSGIPIFPGVLMRADPIPLAPGADPCWRCECADYSVFGDWCFWTKNYTTDQTLKQVLTDLFSEKLNAYSIGLDALQVTGPTLTAPFGWSKARANDVIRDLVDRTGYAYTYGGGSFSMFPPGTDPSPVDLVEADGNIGTLTVHGSEQVPANTVIAEFGPTGVSETPITNTWIADGVATTFALLDVNVHASDVWPGEVVIDGTHYPIWPAGAGGANDIEWDPATDDGTLTFKGTSSSLIGAGAVIDLPYWPLFPFTITRDSGATPPIEVLLSFPTITDYAPALATTLQALASFNQEPRVFTATTLDDGIKPAQALLIDAPSQSVSSVTGTVTRVAGRINTDDFWEYEVTAEETTDLQPDFLTDYRRLSSPSASSSSGSSASFSGVESDGDLALPVTITTPTDGVLTLIYTGPGNPNTALALYRNGTVQGSITTTGGTASYNTTSDRRLKRNIAPAAVGLDDLLAIEIVEYEQIGDDERRRCIGAIAQQMAPFAPECVTLPTAACPWWQVDYGRLTPRLIRAIQRLAAEVGALKGNSKEHRQ